MNGVRASLTKMEISEHFSQIFEDQNNILCFQCGKKSKQWAEVNFGIFLCLGCAALYKQLGKTVNVKSISLDLWSEEELLKLKVGGNQRFKLFLKKYDLGEEQFKKSLKTKAAHYYRIMLEEKGRNREIPEEPSYEEGQEIYKEDLPLNEMSTDQILDEAKEKLNWLGEKTKHYGSKAYDKVHHKITSGELKEDAKKAADKVSETAKGIWGFIRSKIEESQNKNDKKEEEVLIKEETKQ